MRLQGRCGQDSHFQRQLMALRKKQPSKQARAEEVFVILEIVGISEEERTPSSRRKRPASSQEEEGERDTKP